MGLILVANDAVFVLLGEKWHQAAPLIQIMATTNLLLALTHSGGYALLAMGKIRMLAFVIWLQAALFFLTAIFLIPESGATGLAEIRLTVVAIGSLVSIWIVLHQIKALKTSAFLLPLVRPTLATIVMAITLYNFHFLFFDMAPFLRLICEIGIGGLVYSTSIGAMWVLAGRKEGAEAYLLKNFIRQRQ